MKNYISVFCLTVSLLSAGEISTSISENLVNQYFKIVGDHQIFAGKKGSQALWSIKNPRVKFKEGRAEFLATVLFEKDKINIKKDVKKSIEINYDENQNTLQLIIKDALIKMERRGEILGKVDLGVIYQTGLVFPGPKPNFKSFKMKTNLGKIKINILTKEKTIYYEDGTIRFALNLNYETD